MYHQTNDIQKTLYVLIIFIAIVISQPSKPQNEIAQIKGTKSPAKTGKKVKLISLDMQTPRSEL